MTLVSFYTFFKTSENQKAIYKEYRKGKERDQWDEMGKKLCCHLDYTFSLLMYDKISSYDQNRNSFFIYSKSSRVTANLYLQEIKLDWNDYLVLHIST